MNQPRSQEMQTVMDFCLEHAAEVSVPRRVSLYRGLANFCGDAAEAAQLRKMADDLEAADHRCQEFVFQFKKGTLP